MSSDKTRILINIPLELKQEIEKMAVLQNRSVSNYIVTLIQKEIEKEKNKQ